MAITKTQLKAARTQVRELKARVPRAIDVSYIAKDRRLGILLESQVLVCVPIDHVQAIENATASQLRDGQISPSGYGLHFPGIDADIYLPALLEGIFGTRQWMAEQGRKGGKAATPAKKAAAQANGRLGGRPRKVANDELEVA
jgi:hypothetical protein